MNAVQFGRWFSERRRAGGWSSQRLLAEAVQHHTLLAQAGISEDFLSRLEAGHLAYPFQDSVRRRIFLLAWLFCKTQRDLKSYVKAAGISASNEEEHTQFRRLHEHLAAHQTPLLLLPARPQRLRGRDNELEQILNTLRQPKTQIFALTGMPGVGKSALACEVLHRLAGAKNERQRLFPDGIAIFTCTGRQGTHGLISLLHEITALFPPTESHAPGHFAKHAAHASTSSVLPAEQTKHEPELASVINRARAALANRRVLLLLDDLDSAFPLRQMRDLLLAPSAEKSRSAVLLTSQFVPAPTLVSAHLHLQPLSPEAALALLSELLGRELNEPELDAARQACAAVGYLPLAIEGLATAVQASGIPLALVATHLLAHPLTGLQENEAEVVARIEKALASLAGHLRADYRRLATLASPTFDLETAAALFSTPRLAPPELEATRLSAELVKIGPWSKSCGQKDEPAIVNNHLAHLAGTSATLGHFVRASLLENIARGAASSTHDHTACYRMHPLLYHYARETYHH